MSDNEVLEVEAEQLEPLGSEEEFAALVERLVLNEAPRVLALVEEGSSSGPRLLRPRTRGSPLVGTAGFVRVPWPQPHGPLLRTGRGAELSGLVEAAVRR